MSGSVAGIKASLLPVLNLLTASITNYNPFPYKAGFDIKAVNDLAVSLPTHSWEFGVTTEALLELYQPQYSVFGSAPFPVPALPRNASKSLNYVVDKINWGNRDATYDVLDRGNGAAADPASMGVAAVMLGKTEERFADAARRTARGLLEDVPRFSNGAISHRAASPVLWADFMYMVPPFLAYYAADRNDSQALLESVRQCRLYREVLQSDSGDGLWSHIIGAEGQDTGLWATGNGWAAAGMARVLATVMKAPAAEGQSWRQTSINQLSGYIKEILDGAMASATDDGLLRNYMNQGPGPNAFGEIAGTSLLASVAYRMAILRPEAFGQRYIKWADAVRATLSGQDKNGNPHVKADGVVQPAINPLNWRDTVPDRDGSPEGQAFVVLMYAAWRDCVKEGTCPRTEEGSSGNQKREAGQGSPAWKRMIKRSHSTLQRRSVDHHQTN